MSSEQLTNEQKLSNIKEQGLWVSFKFIPKTNRKSQDTMVCHMYQDRNEIAVGIAKRSKKDNPNHVIARTLAYKRALDSLPANKKTEKEVLEKNIFIRTA